MAAKPKAKLVMDQGCRKIWFVEWPSNMRKWGKSYYATTYPDSDLVTLETSARRRPVSPLVARKVMPQIVAAVAAAASPREDLGIGQREEGGCRDA